MPGRPCSNDIGVRLDPILLRAKPCCNCLTASQSGAILPARFLGHRFREFWVRQVRRRDVIKVMAGAAAAWPIAARAQPPDRARLIGVLLPIGKDDPEYQPWVAAFRAALQELGWVDGRNMRIDIHWATSDAAEIRRQAAELVALAPDVILAPGTSTVGALMQATRTVPIAAAGIGQWAAAEAFAPSFGLEL